MRNGLDFVSLGRRPNAGNVRPGHQVLKLGWRNKSHLQAMQAKRPSQVFQLANPFCAKVAAPKRTMVTCLDAVEASRPERKGSSRLIAESSEPLAAKECFQGSHALGMGA